MTLATELDLPVFDYGAEDLRGEHFHARMRDLMEAGWLATSPLGWLFVLDREAATFFLRTRGTGFPARKVAEVFGITEGPLAEAIGRNLISIEGADHRRLRNLVNPAFSKREADLRRGSMRAHLRELWEPLTGREECEFVAEFAKHYPSRMIAEVVGAPLSDAPLLHEWATWFQRQFDPVAILEQREEIERVIVEFHDYAGALIEERRAEPRDDLVSILLEATHEGDRLSESECLNLVMNVIAGGVDTTQAQLAHGMRLFAAHPEQWRRLGAEPDLLPAAVEEVLRYEPITPFTARMTSEEITFRDVTIPPDTVLMISTFAGNRDPGAFSEPLSFRSDADRGREKVMTFGAGIHNCLGASLARAELQEAFAFLAPRMPGLELAGEPRFGTIAGVYELDELRLRWRAEQPS